MKRHLFYLLKHYFLIKKMIEMKDMTKVAHDKLSIYVNTNFLK